MRIQVSGETTVWALEIASIRNRHLLLLFTAIYANFLTGSGAHVKYVWQVGQGQLWWKDIF